MYQIRDLETENHEEYRRFASPFGEKNYIVAHGWKNQGDDRCSWCYNSEPTAFHTPIPKTCTMLVGHNIKFDLLYEWNDPELHAFFQRGGRIWDTQYAEYLLNAQHPDFHMCSMDSIIENYGGRKKIDAVKIQWEMGMLTSQIDSDLLIDYLVGTEEEGRNSGDIGNTELIFLGQIKKAQKLGMLTMIQARMDGLLATTEMEYNGLKVDILEAQRRMKILERELAETDEALVEFIPELPEGLEFNWSSPIHCSCLIFGGTIKYKKSAPYTDEEGNIARKKAYAQWPMIGGVPIDPSTTVEGDDPYDRYLSGKKKGEIKYTKVEVEGEIKTKIQDFFFELKGQTTPDPKWQGALTDGAGDPVYSTGADIIEELGERDIPFLKLMAKRQNITKDLGTYYLRYDPKRKDWVGMLTCVMKGSHIIHHNLNHTKTVTSRLSSDNPNLQNLPTSGTSEVKKMFISRFIGGKMLELDYSQLEVVVQGLLSGDTNLIKDLIAKVDFHCKRVSAKHKITYEEALDRCKNDKHPEYKHWNNERRKVKEFSFQRAYGAGAAKIAESTGMEIDEVKDLIEAEDALYPGVCEYNSVNEKIIKESAKPFKDPIRGFRTFRRGYLTVPTGTRYTFRSYDAPAWLKEKGVADSFMPTEIKNYPIQGTGGEIVQIILGLLFRHFVNNNNYDGKALLCNTVHDCVWIDCEADVVEQVAKDCKRIMEAVPQVLNKLFGMEVPVPFPVEAEIGDNLYDKHVIHI